MGTVHGGVLCDLADVAMGVALATVIAEGESFATLQLQMSYLQPVREGVVRAQARLLHRGRSSAHLECDLLRRRGRAGGAGVVGGGDPAPRRVVMLDQERVRATVQRPAAARSPTSVAIPTVPSVGTDTRPWTMTVVW